MDWNPRGVYLGRISHFISHLAWECSIDNFLFLWNCSKCLITASVIKTEEWSWMTKKEKITSVFCMLTMAFTTRFHIEKNWVTERKYTDDPSQRTFIVLLDCAIFEPPSWVGQSENFVTVPGTCFSRLPCSQCLAGNIAQPPNAGPELRKQPQGSMCLL